jgi:hypothetical protein
MLDEVQTINGSRSAVCTAITNVENASEIVSGNRKVEVLEKPSSGLAGLKW